MEKHPPAYLSASRFSAYERCPQIFHQRYVLKLPSPPSWERDFGTAVHKGLEAHFRDEDHELAFLREWRQATKTCRADGLNVPTFLDERGLELIDMVRRLNLTGVPEKWASIIPAGFIIPIIGYVDLANDTDVWDFKTTGFGWTQQRADRELFQPAIYSQAHADVNNGELPKFTFIVLPRNGGPLQRLDGTRTWSQIAETFERARAIHKAIEAKQFDCTCRGALCGEQAA